MTIIDYAIIAGFFAVLTAAALRSRRYNKSVSDFLAANRCAGRYLITVAQGISGLGAISIIAGFEMFYKAGFSAVWWQLMTLCIMTIIALSGWVLYRLRQTRALTMAQFIEMRYSKKLRIFTGFLVWISGIINYGIFPAVTTRFFIHFCGLPNTFAVYATLMAILILIALFFTFMGGQITVITTDFLQGTFCNIVFVVVILYFLFKFDWNVIMSTLSATAENESMLNPIKTTKTEGFNLWFYLINAFIILYATGTWQGSQGYNACAINPHEGRMGRTLSSWRVISTNLFMIVVAVCVYVFFNNESFAESSIQAKQALAGIENINIREQVTTSVGMRYILPTGLIGCTVAVFLAAAISTDTTYLHSWGSVFIQDVIMPFRKKHLPHQMHLKLLKYSICFVALFVYVFSLIFRQTEYIFMFFMITGAIFTGGGAVVIIGGLYWRRGTTAGAWAGMIVGSTLSVSVIGLKQIYPSLNVSNAFLDWLFNQTGAVLSFYASISAILTYVIVSLLTCREEFDLDKMLNREAQQNKTGNFFTRVKQRGFAPVIGITDEFNLRDKIVYISIFVWTWLLIIIFVVGTLYNIMFDVSNETWATFWKYYVILLTIMAVITTVWFAIGGFRDLRKMFNLLENIKRDEFDDGSVK